MRGWGAGLVRSFKGKLWRRAHQGLVSTQRTPSNLWFFRTICGRLADKLSDRHELPTAPVGRSSRATPARRRGQLCTVCSGCRGTLNLAVTKATLFWDLRVAVLIGKNGPHKPPEPARHPQILRTKQSYDRRSPRVIGAVRSRIFLGRPSEQL